jgi:hypothetical protein
MLLARMGRLMPSRRKDASRGAGPSSKPSGTGLTEQDVLEHRRQTMAARDRVAGPDIEQVGTRTLKFVLRSDGSLDVVVEA